VRSTTHSTLRVLLIHPDQAGCRSVELFLRGLTGEQLSFESASTAEQVERTSKQDWDAILVDLGAGEDESASLARASEKHLVHRPVIRLGKSSDHLITSGAETALDESLAKLQVNGAPLLRSICHLLERRRLENRVEELEKALAEAASVDSMSGLYTVRYFNERLRNDFNEAARYGHVLTLCEFDIARFDIISDTYGYMIADDVLKSVGQIVTACSRKTDYAGRVGSSRFCVAFPNTAIPATLVAVERIRDSLTHKVFTGKSCENFTIEVNYGVAQLQKEHKTFEAFLDNAHEALRASMQKRPGHIEVSYPMPLAG
jgi:diguanylate cyclase (GGDEF)-like protein